MKGQNIVRSLSLWITNSPAVRHGFQIYYWERGVSVFELTEKSSKTCLFPFSKVLFQENGNPISLVWERRKKSTSFWLCDTGETHLNTWDSTHTNEETEREHLLRKWHKVLLFCLLSKNQLNSFKFGMFELNLNKDGRLFLLVKWKKHTTWHTLTEEKAMALGEFRLRMQCARENKRSNVMQLLLVQRLTENWTPYKQEQRRKLWQREGRRGGIKMAATRTKP